jgi:hypothetical protein
MLQHRLVILFLALFAGSLGCGGGCDGMTPTPGGFPAAERTANAGQVRVAQSGLQKIAADPAALLGPLLGGMGLSFDVPASCGGSPAVCCVGGQPVTPCGPIDIDLMPQAGDPPRLTLTPVSGQSRLDVVLRARVKTRMDIPVSGIPLAGDCTVRIDTTSSNPRDMRMDIQVAFRQDAMAGTTRVEVASANLSQLDENDVSLQGSLLCTLADAALGLFIDQFTGTFEDAIVDAIGGAACKSCTAPSDCGQFASACTDGVCTKADGTCLQELGIAGRLTGSSMLGDLSPGTLGGFDVYEVAGGYATSNNNGLALGLLGGMLPAGTPRDRCGPAATAPAPVTIPQSAFFQGNTRPDTGAAFDLAFGLHESQLDEFAYAAYDGGFLCLTIGTSSVPLLTTDTIGILAGSIGNLVSETSPVALGLRPQAPPTIVLGENRFVDQGGTQVLEEPLLDLTFDNLELDFFAAVEHQYIRLFTVVTDLRLPIGLQVGPMGDLVPVFGDLAGAFTEVSVKNSEAVAEPPAQIAAVFPSLLELALPSLGDGLGSFDLPAIGGLSFDVTGITAVDNKSFLAIFANLAPAPMARVTATASVRALREPASELFADPASWSATDRPVLELELGADGVPASELEWSIRVDGTSWSAWSTAPVARVSPHTFWLAGEHTVEVSARRRGQPLTADQTPAMIKLPIGPAPRELAAEAQRQGFHGQAGAGGCSCAADGGGAGAALPGVLVGLTLLLRGRRRRARGVRVTRVTRALRRLAPTLGALVLVALLPSCDCGNAPPCGDVACLPGEVERGVVGRFNGAATDGTRTVVSTYDQGLGDLVLVEIAADGSKTFAAVDGVPDETPAYEPSTYRGGVSNPGPNVGTWTSVVLDEGLARIAYHDVDAGALRFARETTGGTFVSYGLDGATGGQVGLMTSIALDGEGKPVIAYLATALDDAGGGKKTELRLARALVRAPDQAEWNTSVIASAPASCAEVCGAGLACVAPAVEGEPEVCVTPEAACPSPCADDEVCTGGVCRAEITRGWADLPTGTGLFVSLGLLNDGRLVVTYYDRVRTALVLAAENAAGSSTFTETVLDDAGDRGMWASAAVDGNTVHVAYQDALADTLLYTSWASTPAAPVVVDDGVRAGDRTHPVGAGAAMFVRNGVPGVAYQDGLSADVVVATQSGATWTPAALPAGAGVNVDGFHIAAASSGGSAWLAWDQIVVGDGADLAVSTAP